MNNITRFNPLSSKLARFDPLWDVDDMLQRALVVIAITGALAFSCGFASAADQERTQQVQKQQRVYGSQLMTKEERAEYRAKMRAAKTVEEREQIRKEHHEHMKERAKERGITLPDKPPARGGGMGSGCGVEPCCCMGAGKGISR